MQVLNEDCAHRHLSPNSSLISFLSDKRKVLGCEVIVKPTLAKSHGTFSPAAALFKRCIDITVSEGVVESGRHVAQSVFFRSYLLWMFLFQLCAARCEPNGQVDI